MSDFRVYRLDALGVEVIATPFVDGNADRMLSKVAGYEVRVWKPAELGQIAGTYGLPGPGDFPYGYAFYEVKDGRPIIHLTNRVANGLRSLTNGSWKHGGPGAARDAAISLFAFGREVGHARFKDVMHGRPGHDDPRANKLAWRRLGLYGRRLGLSPTDVRRMRQLLRRVGTPPQLF